MLAFRCTTKSPADEAWSGELNQTECAGHLGCLAGRHVAHSLGSLAGKCDPLVSATLSPAGACERLRHGGELHILEADSCVDMSTEERARASLAHAYCLDWYEYETAVWQAPKHAEVLLLRGSYQSRVLARVARAEIPPPFLERSERWGCLDWAEQEALESELLAWARSLVERRTQPE